MPKILLVEDNESFCDLVRDSLEHNLYTVDVATDGRQALDYLSTYSYELLILDWDLPHLSGIEVLKHLRASKLAVPVLMLTGKSTMDDKETGFESGADDYLTKPVSIRELNFRVKALLRRAPARPSNELTVGNLVLDPISFTARKGEKELKLLKKEFHLLEYFMNHPNQTFSLEALLDQVWSIDDQGSTEAVRSTIYRLKKKIDHDGRPPTISNIVGVGYKLDAY